jgi:hypothetical protein
MYLDGLCPFFLPSELKSEVVQKQLHGWIEIVYHPHSYVEVTIIKPWSGLADRFDNISI